MVVVLAGEGAGSSGRVKELESEKVTLEVKTRKFKTAFERSQEMFQEQADMLAGEKERAEKALEGKDCLLLDKELWESERERLEREVIDLKVAMMLVEGEPEGVTSLHTRTDFVARVQILESDCVNALANNFKAVVNQLSVLNPGLNTEGTGL